MSDWTLGKDGALRITDPKNGRVYAISEGSSGYAVDAISRDGRAAATIERVPLKSDAMLRVLDRLNASAATLNLPKPFDYQRR